MTKPTCERCGQVHPRTCTGHVEECTGCGHTADNVVNKPCVSCGGDVVERPCRNWAIRGGKVCRSHGGASRHVRAAADRRVANAQLERQAETLAERLGITLASRNPQDQLLEACDEAGFRMAIWRAVTDGLRLPGGEGEGQVLVSPELRVHPADERLARWVSLSGELTAKAISVGLDERRVRLAESHTERLFDAVSRAFVEAEGPPGMVSIPRFREALVAQLRELAA